MRSMLTNIAAYPVRAINIQPANLAVHTQNTFACCCRLANLRRQGERQAMQIAPATPAKSLSQAYATVANRISRGTALKRERSQGPPLKVAELPRVARALARQPRTAYCSGRLPQIDFRTLPRVQGVSWPLP